MSRPTRASPEVTDFGAWSCATSTHDRCVEYGAQAGGGVNYSKGANIGGFVKVADALLAYGPM